MGSYINTFLKTEITVIPGLLDKYVGKYYNNTLCNGATWMFALWYMLHVLFDHLLNALLKRMKYKEYMRIRLKQSLWYLGFYASACVYCGATLWRNDLQIVKIKHPFDSTTPSGHLVLGFIVLTTFYLHSAAWERLKYWHGMMGASYLALFFLFSFSYFLRFIEGIFRLTILICTTQVALELARCLTVLTKIDKLNTKMVGVLYVMSTLAFIINYLIVIPVLFGYPLVKELSSSAIILSIILLTYLVLTIYDSVLSKGLKHWFTHRDTFEEEKTCDRNLFECSLFPARGDATYNFLLLRKEMKDREEKCMSLRRPKNRNMVMQTLKCMVAIKKKMKEKRQNASKNNVSEDTSESTEDNINDVFTNENKAVGGKLEFNIHENENGAIKFKKD